MTRPSRMCARCLRLAQLELGAPRQHDLAVVEELDQQPLERQQLRLAVDQRQHVEAERLLHRGVLVQVVQHRVRVRVALDLDDQPHALAIALVLHRRDAVDLLLAHQLGDALLQHRFVDLIRQLGDDDLRAPMVGFFELDPRPNQHPPAPGCIGVFDVVDDQAFAVFFEAHHQAAGRKIGAFDELQQVVDGRLRDCRSDGAAHRPLRPGCAAACSSPCPPRCPPSRCTAGSESGLAAPSARRASRRSWGSCRRCPCRDRPAFPSPAASAAPRCSAWPRAGRRRPSRSSPGRRPAGSAC